jgi:hypothetical protein
MTKVMDSMAVQLAESEGREFRQTLRDTEQQCARMNYKGLGIGRNNNRGKWTIRNTWYIRTCTLVVLRLSLANPRYGRGRQRPVAILRVALVAA